MEINQAYSGSVFNEMEGDKTYIIFLDKDFKNGKIEHNVGIIDYINNTARMKSYIPYFVYDLDRWFDFNHQIYEYYCTITIPHDASVRIDEFGKGHADKVNVIEIKKKDYKKMAEEYGYGSQFLIIYFIKDKDNVWIYKCINKGTPLTHWVSKSAVEMEDIKLLKLLLEKGCNINKEECEKIAKGELLVDYLKMI
jgi:uncharacterized protein YqfB (UPF0267 family)